LGQSKDVDAEEGFDFGPGTGFKETDVGESCVVDEDIHGADFGDHSIDGGGVGKVARVGAHVESGTRDFFPEFFESIRSTSDEDE
jgi:hypothetical protein